jgi:hypothetical protein
MASEPAGDWTPDRLGKLHFEASDTVPLGGIEPPDFEFRPSYRSSIACNVTICSYDRDAFAP